MSNLLKFHRLGTKRAFLEAGDVPKWIKRQREINLLVSYPYWVTKQDLAPFDEEVKRKTAETGISHSIDHLIPLRHPLVCGLTVPANLRVITTAHDGRKGSKFNPEAFDLPKLKGN